MTEDARFEDGREAPLNIGALDGEDLQVLSALVQDAVFPVTEMTWRAKERRFAILLNRFRWEDAQASGPSGRAQERVQSLLVIDNVLKVSSQGVDRNDKDTVLSLMAINFEGRADSNGDVVLTLAGDGGLKFEVEALEVSLKDVTRPYIAPSGRTPDHGA